MGAQTHGGQLQPHEWGARATSRVPAQLALAAGAVFAVLLVALHVVKPEIDPSWRFISEYAIGNHGWIMVLALFALALGQFALFLALRPRIATLGGRIGLVCLLVGAAGLGLAGAFTSDPITTTAPSTTSGQLHALGGTLGMGMPFAVLLVSWALARNPAWSSLRRPLLWTAGLAFLGFLVSAVSLGVLLSHSAGRFGPDVPVGWPTRFEILTYDLWLMAVAWSAIRVSGRSPAEARG